MTTDQLKKDISYYGNYYSYHASGAYFSRTSWFLFAAGLVLWHRSWRDGLAPLKLLTIHPQIARHTDAVGTTCDPMSDPGPIDTTHIPTGIPGVQPINTQPVFVNGMYNPSTGHYQLHDEVVTLGRCGRRMTASPAPQPIVHADFNPSSIEVGQIVSNQAPAANSGHAAMATPIDHVVMLSREGLKV
eukprot:746641-Hanusia_phi.AAC.2